MLWIILTNESTEMVSISIGKCKFAEMPQSVYECVCMFLYVIYLGAGAGHGAVADRSPGAGKPPTRLPEDHL